ncbi:protein HIT1, partial [Lipomyces oligophaga]|uniref:protein HIT1 n=1 Tax=Lipomyces oligophaga TaxID=45792 RepID=UPI0034CE0292
ILCGICREASSNYKCPTCSVRYCSIKCYKDERHSHSSAVNENPQTQLQTEHLFEVNKPSLDNSTTLQSELTDPVLSSMLSSSTLQHHLFTVYQILQDQSLSGESTSEGRRNVALKKLRELRAGGLEENQEVEDFVQKLMSVTR